MLFDVVREFVALSGSGGVRGRSLDRARELMVVLRRAGFDSAEISLLSGGRWPAGNIRTYSRGWGGVDDSLVMEKEGIMASLRGLASSGMGVGDVDVVLALDRSVKAKGSSLEEVAELNGHLGDFGIKPGEVGELVKLSRDLKLAPLTPGAVKDWMAVDEDLEARKAELEKVKGEITEKARLNTALRSTLEEAQREYTNNLDVQLVVELLVNPRGFTVDRLEVAHLLARVLESGAQRIEVNAGLVELPSPILEAAVADMRRLANRLRSLGDVKPGGP
jgi:hypothetical protein